MLSRLGEEYNDNKILINRIIYDNFDVDKFNNCYDIYILKYIGEKGWIDFNAEFFDKLDDKNKIESVSYVCGKCVYLLLQKGERIEITDVFNEESTEFTLENFFLEEVDKEIESERWKIDTAYNLLMNALGKYPDENPGFSNTRGQLYMYVGTNKTGKDQQIVMDIKIKDGLLLRRQVSFRLFNEDNPKDKKKTKYSFIEGQGLTLFVKRYKGDGKAYIRGGYRKKKIIIEVDNLYLKNNKATKAKIYDELSRHFNNKYGEFAKLEYKCVSAKTKTIEEFKKVKKKKEANINTLEGVYYVRIAEPESENEINKEEQFVQELKNIYPKLKIAKTIKENGCNVILIHDSDYYIKNKIKDEKMDINNKVISQCVTLENITSKKSESLKNYALHVLSELFVKDDLYRGIIKRWRFGETEFYIGIKKKIDNEEREIHCLMHIFDDCRFEITSEKENIDKNHYRKYINEIRNQGNICIVRQGNEYNKIVHTNLMPMIDNVSVDKLIKRSSQKGNKTRIKDRCSLMEGLVFPYYGKTVMNIKDENGKENLHYTVGESKNGIQTQQMSMCNIYKIEPIEGSDTLYSILDMLEDPHVRGGLGESVRPYPFKYMMEFIRINNPGISFSL